MLTLDELRAKLPRFWSKVTVTGNADDSCWLWTGSLYANGYGQAWNGARPEQTHRIAFRQNGGVIASGFEIDHLCKVRACVRPSHLRCVSHRENMMNSDTIFAKNSRKSACLNGHPLSGANLVVTRQGARQCRVCKNRRQAEFKRKRRHHD